MAVTNRCGGFGPLRKPIPAEMFYSAIALSFAPEALRH
jgi:hypothetical protein